jgi:signal transduction histidine kinase
MFQPDGRAPYVYHEIRQPLAAILTNAQAALRWLNRDLPDVDEARQAIERIVGNSLCARDLINDASGIGSALPSAMSQVDINEMVKEIVGLVSVDLRRWDIGVEIALATGFLPVLGNTNQISQVVAYLATRGIEAMAAVSDRPRMLKFATRLDSADGVLFSVAHSGIGLDPISTGRHSGPSPHARNGGLDIGLSICRSIVKAHGGRLWAEPNLPQGSIYHVVLPIA